MMTANTNYTADTLDDLMMKVFDALRSCNTHIRATRGSFTEILGASLTLNNPRARLSRSETRGRLFSALGEFFWYMSGTNCLDFIDYYNRGKYQCESENGSVNSGYGDRFFNKFGVDQFDKIINLLKAKPSSRQAVMQIFSARDIDYDPSDGECHAVPCTCTLQFLLRDGRLNLLVNMRSNDAYLGLPHDVFAFTMIQEYMARCLSVDVGIYKQFVGSLHLYEDNKTKAEEFASEGWQTGIPMNEMPSNDSQSDFRKVQKFECSVRTNEIGTWEMPDVQDYWKDICRILVIWKHLKNFDFAQCATLRSEFNSDFYHVFVDEAIERRANNGNASSQRSGN